MTINYAASRPPHGIMFHHFHGDGHSVSQGSIDAERLRALLDFIGTENILPAREWRDRAVAGDLAPGQLCLSFDDALLCQYEIARPVLAERNLTAFWFVHTTIYEGVFERTELYRTFRHKYFASIDGFYERFGEAVFSSAYGDAARAALVGFEPDEYGKEFAFYTTGDRWFHYVRDKVLGRDRYFEVMDRMIEDSDMDVASEAERIWLRREHVAALHEQGHVIGLHSHTHPTHLQNLGADEQRWEYARNAEILTEISGARPDTVSHPCNSYTAATLDCLADLGVTMGFRANMAEVADRGVFEFRREDHSNIVRMMTAAGVP